MFGSKAMRLAKASIGVLYGILKNSETFKVVKGGNNETKYELDNCYISFNSIINKIVMTSKGEAEQKTTIDCHYDSYDKVQEMKNNSYHDLVELARKKSQKYYENIAKENLKAVRDAIKKSKTIKRIEPDKYNARYELDTCIIDFDSARGYNITVIQKDKDKTTVRIEWADMKDVSWRKFYKLLDSIKEKYEKEQKRMAGQKVYEQLEFMKQIQNGYEA